MTAIAISVIVVKSAAVAKIQKVIYVRKKKGKNVDVRIVKVIAIVVKNAVVVEDLGALEERKEKEGKKVQPEQQG
ncbi:hypothetical protein [Bacillus sp. AFS017336]|uniref:hypothetical protein n=1 Tax=Bacillus sp. AFS017336 TaxID=2033489 RepID=UPI001C54D7BF|nr:hypothetical protein [Bacillus sp. AFS017336]